ncbi:MAG: hypothetical protein NTW16_15975, partial [Bacteroidetes bacterium]|nr:hypothetical protein [Bacteroidota bacterium]
MNKLTALLIAMTLVFVISTPKSHAQSTVGGAGANYATLKAAFDAINAGMITGIITLQITGNTTETASAVLYQNGYGGTSDYTSVVIYPTGSGYSIGGNLAGPLISLNGADNVIIDGRVNQLGGINLTINNTSISNVAATSTLQFINSAETNTVQYCTIKGSETIASSGIIFFSTATSGNGNDGNTIDNNNITSSAGGRPVNSVFSFGSTGFENSQLLISNNNFYDFLKNGTASNGINLSSFTTACTITDNSFYETNSFTPSASVTYNIIYINNSTGVNFTVSDNYIGGQSAFCGGNAWTKTNAFNNICNAIYLNVGTALASDVQNNVIRNFAWNNSLNAAWTGINIAAGNVNIGTNTGNSIGASTGNGSIIITSGSTAANVYGINIASTGIVDCEFNTIASITSNTTNSAFANNITGIYKSAVAGTTTISNNTIGSLSTANSINANSASTANAQNVFGIYNAGSGAINLNNNTIANITNSTANLTITTAGVINGIASINGTNIITNNNINNLTIANANTAATNAASICGIALTGATLKTVTGNTIYNLSNTCPSFAGNIIGLFYTGSTGANVVSGNFIHSLSVTGAASTAASLYGIKINTGRATYVNNIINLGGSTATTIFGIYDLGTSGNHNNLYFNSVFIGGNAGSGVTNMSYALYSAGSVSVRNFRNNIFQNSRSTTGGTSLHYAAFFNYAVNTSLTLDYNDYYAPGTGGVLGYYSGSNKIALPLVTALDANSLAVDPVFPNPGGTIATDYDPSSAILAGTTISTIPTDYLAITRAGTPTMGALEGTLNLNVDVYKTGVLLSTYPRLKNAFDKINNGTHSGSLEIRIKASTIETASAVLYQSGYSGAGGISNYSSVKVFPTVPGIAVTGNLTAPLIDLNAADSITLDGRLNATGNEPALTLTNTNTGTSASTIRFINSAENNIVKYCTIKGSQTSPTTGIVFLSTSAAGNGNDGNTIENNNITSHTAGRPINAVFSLGSTGFENSGNSIRNNNIFDFFKHGTASYGINISSFNTSWAITGNHFYETTAYAPLATVAYNVIQILNASGGAFTVSGNYIGGSSPSCGGAPWTKTNAFNNAFNAINLSVGTTSVSSIQNNFIQNFAWSNSLNATWTGINIAAGNVNVGTTTGNSIGALTGTGSIVVTGATAANVYGINVASTGTVDCQKNAIG